MFPKSTYLGHVGHRGAMTGGNGASGFQSVGGNVEQFARAILVDPVEAETGGAVFGAVTDEKLSVAEWIGIAELVAFLHGHIDAFIRDLTRWRDEAHALAFIAAYGVVDDDEFPLLAGVVAGGDGDDLMRPGNAARVEE